MSQSRKTQETQTPRQPKNNLWREFLLGWRLMRQYIVRGRKWTLGLTTLLVAVAFINLAFISSLLAGVTSAIESQIKNLMVGEAYIDVKKPGEYITNVDDKLAEIKRIDGVTAADKILAVPAVLGYNDDKQVQARINVVNPRDFRQTLEVANRVSDGTFLAGDDEIVLGSRLLERGSLEGVKVGDRVTISINGKKVDVKVGGITSTKFYNADIQAYISRGLWRKLTSGIPSHLTAGENDASMIVVRTSRGKEASVQRALTDLNYPGLRVHDWRDGATVMDTITGSFQSLNAIMLIVGIIIAAVTIFIVIYVDIINKRRQIGIQRAIGVKPRVIVFSYVLLALFYAMCGIAVGLAIFLGGLVPYVVAHPFSLPIADVTLNISWWELLFRAEVVLVVAIISGAIPAIMASRMKMLEAILGKG